MFSVQCVSVHAEIAAIDWSHYGENGTTSLIVTVDENGKVTGKFGIGGRPELQDQAMYPAIVLPFRGSKLEVSQEVAAL